MDVASLKFLAGEADDWRSYSGVLLKESESVAVVGNVEQRQHTRYVVDAWAEVILKDGSMLFRGRVLDVSAGGCYIETAARLQMPVGTPVEIVFRLKGQVFRCEAASRMMRAKGAGFLFERMDVRTSAQLQELTLGLDEADWTS